MLEADLVIGAVLVPGAAAPKLITREARASDMKRGSVMVDISIDQGGCSETSRPTTHADPTYVVHGVVHYCVTNMPGAVARTSTFALNNATLPFVLALADKGPPRRCWTTRISSRAQHHARSRPSRRRGCAASQPRRSASAHYALSIGQPPPLSFLARAGTASTAGFACMRR